MNNLWIDIGHLSINKYGEQLCGDHIDIIKQDDNSTVIVLADGLGSGVKANILSTLTSKIISTMIAAGMEIEDCVSTIVSTLPVCNVRNLAYSTFTIIQITNYEEAVIIHYDNPPIILLRDGQNVELTYTIQNIYGKNIYFTRTTLQERDIFVTMSDGALHAGVGEKLNFGWDRKEIISFLKTIYPVEFTAKTLSTILIEECNKLYGGKPGDDTTVCTISVRKREAVHLLIGPPADPKDCYKMMSLFFAKQGKHIVCGGTTSQIAADYLGKKVVPALDYLDGDIPPIAHIDGVDLVTEGVITINKVLTYASSYLKDNESYSHWCYKQDGASQISRLLFERATDINFYVGKAVNSAHQNSDLPINFSIKMHLVEQLSKCLKLMGKQIKVSYF